MGEETMREQQTYKKQQKTYEKPTVIFDKNLEALAGICDPIGDRLYSGGGIANYCKESGFCAAVLDS